MTRRAAGWALLLVLGAHQAAPLAASIAPHWTRQAAVAPAAHDAHAGHAGRAAAGDSAPHRPGCPWRDHAGPCPHGLRADSPASPAFASCPVPATGERAAAVGPGRGFPTPPAAWMSLNRIGSLEARPVPSTLLDPIAPIEHRPPRMARA